MAVMTCMSEQCAPGPHLALPLLLAQDLLKPLLSLLEALQHDAAQALHDGRGARVLVVHLCTGGTGQSMRVSHMWHASWHSQQVLLRHPCPHTTAAHCDVAPITCSCSNQHVLGDRRTHVLHCQSCQCTVRVRAPPGSLAPGITHQRVEVVDVHAQDARAVAAHAHRRGEGHVALLVCLLHVLEQSGLALAEGGEGRSGSAVCETQQPSAACNSALA